MNHKRNRIIHVVLFVLSIVFAGFTGWHLDTLFRPLLGNGVILLSLVTGGVIGFASARLTHRFSPLY